MRGKSRCLTCEIELRPSEMIPVVSYFLLRGRCRSCATPISVQYPLVEFLTGALFLAFYLRYAQGFALPDYVTPENMPVALVRDLLFISFLMVVFVYDLRYVEILDRFTVPAMGVALLFNLRLGMDARSLVAGAGVIGGFFLFQYAVSRGRWVGGGDIRMGLLMGFMLGIRDGLMALFLAYLAGALLGLVLIASRRADWKTALPFGTFLSAATVVVLLFGKPIVYWYLGLFM